MLKRKLLQHTVYRKILDDVSIWCDDRLLPFFINFFPLNSKPGTMCAEDLGESAAVLLETLSHSFVCFYSRRLHCFCFFACFLGNVAFFNDVQTQGFFFVEKVMFGNLCFCTKSLIQKS